MCLEHLWVLISSACTVPSFINLLCLQKYHFESCLQCVFTTIIASMIYTFCRCQRVYPNISCTAAFKKKNSFHFWEQFLSSIHPFWTVGLGGSGGCSREENVGQILTIVQEPPKLLRERVGQKCIKHRNKRNNIFTMCGSLRLSRMLIIQK